MNERVSMYRVTGKRVNFEKDLAKMLFLVEFFFNPYFMFINVKYCKRNDAQSSISCLYIKHFIVKVNEYTSSYIQYFII